MLELLKPSQIKRETNYDIILKAYLEHKTHDLPDVLQEQLNRWKKCNELIRDGKLVKKGKNNITQPYRYHDIVNFIVQTYGVSTRTAREDIRHTKFFFSNETSKEEKDFGRGVMIEWGERLMFEAAGVGDYKSAAAFFREIAAIKGLHDKDEDRPKYEDLQIPHLIIVADPSELGFEKIDDSQIDKAVEKILQNRKRSKLDAMIDNSEVVQIIEETKIGNGS
jgi:hypothetical protein